MAMELGFGVAGIVLAWKNIIGFGELIIKLCEDDSDQREALFDRLLVSQYSLKDWGDYWGVDREDGRFHSFETERKELIMRIISRLVKSRKQAVDRLKSRYGVQEDGDDDDAEDDPGGRSGVARGRPRLFRQKKVDVDVLFTKMRGKVKTAVHKGRWLARDKDVITAMVDDTESLREHLQCLTRTSQNFVIDTLVQELQVRLSRTPSPLPPAESMELKPSPSKTLPQRPVTPDLKPPRITRPTRTLQQTLEEYSESLPEGEVDCSTLASYAVKSMPTNSQASRIHYQIEMAFDAHGDPLALEETSTWWNEPCSDIMVLEAPDMADDLSSTLTCAMLYYLAPCQKLIYTFDEDMPDETEPLSRFNNMLRSLIRGLITLSIERSPGEQDMPSLPEGLGIFDEPTASEASGDSFHRRQSVELLEVMYRLIHVIDEAILIVIEGIEQLLALADTSEGALELLRDFISRFQDSCDSRDDRMRLKILLESKGHATSLYNLEERGNLRIADFTRLSVDTIGIREHLSTSLRGPD